MNKKYILSALAGVAVMLSSCSDEAIETGKGTIKYAGDEILFVSNAGYEAAGADEDDAEGKTRTVYTDQYGTNGNQKYEEVHWVVGDKVRIYCPDAHDSKYVDYQVTAIENDDASNADYEHKATALSSINDRLKWSDGTKQHTFYATYPSPVQNEALISLNTFGDNSSTITGYIPQTQLWESVSTTSIDNTDMQNIQNGQYQNGIPEGVAPMPEKGDWHIFEPNMDYAWMVAKTVVENPNEVGNTVTLDFMPIATAIEITLRNVAWKDGVSAEQTKIDVINVGVRSDKSPLFGGFTTDLAKITENADGIGEVLPTDVTVNSNYASGNVISFSTLSSENGESGSPLTLNYGDALTFTVFVLPTTDIEDLQITINGVQGAATGTLTGVKIEKHKKTFLNKVPLTGDVLPFTYANWMRFIDNTTFVRRLSIPGTGGSASYALAPDGSTPLSTDADVIVKHNMVRQQTVDIATQWNKGVRVFEFSVDLATDGSGNLGNSDIICSGISTGVKLSKAIDEIRAKMDKHPYECAMAIITYETSGGWSGTRTPDTFIQQLNKFWATEAAETQVSSVNSNITIQTALYDPSTATMGNSRGKLFCIARPTSEHQDYGTDVIDTLAYATAKMNNGGTQGTYNREAGARSALLPSSKVIKDWTNMSLTTPHEHIMVIHGWGTLKDKWQQRGYTNLSKRKTGSTHTFDTEYDGYTYGSETTAEPGRPFDGLQYHTHNDGWGSITWAPTIEEEEEETKNYTVALNVTENSSNISSLTVNSVTINEESITTTNSDGYYELDLGTTLPTSNFDIVVDVTGTYISKGGNTYTDDFEYTYEVDPAVLTYTNNLYTFIATATYKSKELTVDGSITGPTDYSSDDSSSSTSGTYYGNGPSPSDYAITASVISKLQPDFHYDVVAGSNTVANGAWVQEWERVSNSETEYRDHTATSCRDGKSGCSGPYASYWAPSYNEKIQRVKEALSAAMSKTYGDITYINSLCGYYITAYYPASFAPCSLTDCGYNDNEVWVLSASSPISGMGGDIATFAEQINKDFYNHLLGVDTDYEAGSMGIVLLNRVDGTAGSKIPGIIIANNFRFDITESTTTEGSNGDAGTSDEEAGAESAPRFTDGGFSLSWW